MKLAEALILRADCQKRVEQLKQRLIRSAKVQEGDEPAENPQELIVELERVSDELVGLIKRINKTNSASQFREDATLSDALAARARAVGEASRLQRPGARRGNHAERIHAIGGEVQEHGQDRRRAKARRCFGEGIS